MTDYKGFADKGGINDLRLFKQGRFTSRSITILQIVRIPYN